MTRFKITLFILSALLLLSSLTVSAAQTEAGMMLTGHTGPVFTLAFSPDGQTLLSGGSGEDYSVRVWDVTTGESKFVLEGHEAQIAAVGFSGDGSQILTVDYDAVLNIWDANSGELVNSITETDAGELLNVENLNAAFSADGSKLVYGTDSGVGLYVFDLTTQAQNDISTDKDGLTDAVSTLAVGQDETGAYIVAGADYDGVIHLINAEDGAETALLEPAEPVLYYDVLKFSPDGQWLATVNDEPSVIDVWDLATGTVASSLVGHTPNSDGSLGVYGLAWSPDGSCLASASYDQTVRIWDVAGAQERTSFPVEAGSAVVAWSPDGSKLAAADLDGTIHMWDVSCEASAEA